MHQFEYIRIHCDRWITSASENERNLYQLNLLLENGGQGGISELSRAISFLFGSLDNKFIGENPALDLVSHFLFKNIYTGCLAMNVTCFWGVWHLSSNTLSSRYIKRKKNCWQLGNFWVYLLFFFWSVALTPTSIPYSVKSIWSWRSQSEHGQL